MHACVHTCAALLICADRSQKGVYVKARMQVFILRCHSYQGHKKVDCECKKNTGNWLWVSCNVLGKLTYFSSG